MSILSMLAKMPTIRHMPKKSTATKAPVGRPSSLIDTRVIYCGNNLEKLRTLPDKCIDLIYIDPPFNSNRNYEVFWGEDNERRAFDDRHASTEAYIQFMEPRCRHLHRVLKDTGSFYYHCDWHASHYVKVMLDVIFKEDYFKNEIIWQRTNSHNDAGQYGRIHDTIFFYVKSAEYTWHVINSDYGEAQLGRYKKGADGRLYTGQDMTAARPDSDSGKFEWRGTMPSRGRGWGYTLEQLEKWWDDGLILTKKDGTPRMDGLKKYLDKMPGKPLQSVWTDIPRIANTSSERLGYPTQKPLALLNRIISASSNPNDIILDAFCGCGTALEAAQHLGRQWIGIDVSPRACAMMAQRMHRRCGLTDNDALWQMGRGYTVRDLPRTVEELRKMPFREFEEWAVIRLNGVPNKAKVGDMGIDGKVFPLDAIPQKTADESGQLGFLDNWLPVQVKQVDKTGRPDIDSFETAMNRAKKKKGYFVSFDFTLDAEQEVRRVRQSDGLVIKMMRVVDMLNDDKLFEMLS